MDDKEPPECSCEICKGMCGRSCWPTPLEASTLIGLGYGSRMMLDYWQGSPTGIRTFDEDGDEEYSDIYIICGASKGYEGRFANFMFQKEPCVFQTKQGLCEIHNVCKPLEGRMATCDESFESKINYHKEIAIMWESWEGKLVNSQWSHSKKSFKV